MKLKTLKTIRFMKKIMNAPKKAFLWFELKENKTYYTYPVGGWIESNDDVSDEEIERILKILDTTSRRIVLGTVKKI